MVLLLTTAQQYVFRQDLKILGGNVLPYLSLEMILKYTLEKVNFMQVCLSVNNKDQETGDSMIKNLQYN